MRRELDPKRDYRFLPVASSQLRLESRAGETEDDPEVRMLVGYAAVFNSDSEDMWGYVEQIRPGSFEGALEISDVRALFNHDSNNVLGRNKSKTLRLEEDQVGLRFEIDLPETTLANDLVELVKRGDVSGNSFSFIVAEEEWDHENNTRTITRVEELFDVGPVTYPAYPGTVLSARALEMIEKPKSEDAGGTVLEYYERRAQLRGHELR